jgi:hypothetical protein
MPLKFSAAANRAEVIPLVVNNERFPDPIGTELHSAHRIDHLLFAAVHNSVTVRPLFDRSAGGLPNRRPDLKRRHNDDEKYGSSFHDALLFSRNFCTGSVLRSPQIAKR